jgi:hypothetical protein
MNSMPNRLRVVVRFIRIFTALILCAALGAMIHLRLMTPVNAMSTVAVVETAAITRVRAQAAQYTQAMNTIVSLSTTPVRTSTDVTRTVDQIKRLDAPLSSGLPKKLIVIGLDNATFKQAIEREAARLGPKIFYDRVLSNPKILLNFRGSSEISQAINRQVLGDGAKLKKTSAFLSQAAALRGRAQNNFRENRNVVRAEVIHANHASMVVPQGGVGEGLIITALIGAAVLLIGSYAAILSKGHEVPPATEDNPNPVSPVAKCIDEAILRRDRCLARSDFWGDLACAAIYLADRADCLFLPQA